MMGATSKSHRLRRLSRIRATGATGRPARRHRDSGIGLVLLLGVTTVLMILVGVSITVGVNSLASARRHLHFEAALDAAETGLDGTMGQIQVRNETGQSPFESPVNCRAAWTWPSGSIPSAAVERNWVISALDSMPDSCVQHGGEGEYITFRAVDQNNQQVNVLYSVGWAPDRNAFGSVRRIVKAQYVLTPYNPVNAILTEASLTISGSVEVSVAPPATSSDIHSNGAVEVTNNSLLAAGSVSATGTNSISGTCPNSKITGTCTELTPRQTVPRVDARRVYNALAATVPGSWYDLCPNGSVREPDPAAIQPCQDAAGVLSATGSYRGWSFDNASHTWTFEPVDGTDYPGVYYAYQSNIVIGGSNRNGPPSTLTAIAEANFSPSPAGPASACGKSGGDLTWSHTNIANYLPGLVFLADGKVVGTANADVSKGMIAAGDNIDINTSSSTITGSIVSSNICAARGGSTLQGVKVAFDSNSEVALFTHIRTTGWIEMTG